jgi:hypothetical protein
MKTIKQRIKIEMAKTIRQRIKETPIRDVTGTDFKKEIIRILDGFINS